MTTTTELRIQLTKTASQLWGLEFALNANSEISVRNILPNSTASHSNLRLGDVLVSANGRDARTMSLNDISPYFKTISTVDLVVRRVVPRPSAPLPNFSRTASTSSTREVIDLLDDDDDDPPPVPTSSTPRPAPQPAAMAASTPNPLLASAANITPNFALRPAAPTASQLPPRHSFGSARSTSEVIDLVSTDEESGGLWGGEDSDDEDFALPAGRFQPRQPAPASRPPVRAAPAPATAAPRPSNGQYHVAALALGGRPPQQTVQGLPQPPQQPVVQAATQSVGQKRPLPTSPPAAAAADADDSGRKKIKIGKVEVKLEHEPKAFGECDVGDEVVEVTDPNNSSVLDIKDEPGSTDNNTSGGMSRATSAAVMDLDDDEDIAILGGNMQTLSDMPHQRESCSAHPFAQPSKVPPQQTQRNIEFCPNCYCYVCDVNASFCGEWRDHCHATYKEARWKVEKQARTSRIMSLMAPELKSKFFAQHKTYMYTRPSNSIKGFMQGDSSRTYTGAPISHQDRLFASEMIELIRHRLNTSFEMAIKQSAAAAASSSSSGSLVDLSAASQVFLEAAALLLKFITMPTFSAWDFEILPELFVGWLFHSCNSEEVRRVYREEINGMLMSRGATPQFKLMVKLLDVKDLRFSWLSSKAGKGPPAVPADFAQMVVADTSTLLLVLSELSRLNRLPELLALLESSKSGESKLRAGYYLIVHGGNDRTVAAANLLASLDANTWKYTFLSGEGKDSVRELYRRLPVAKLLLFFAYYMDTMFDPDLDAPVHHSLKYLLSFLTTLIPGTDPAAVLKKLAAYLRTPPAAMGPWLVEVFRGHNNSLSPADEAAVLCLFLLSYVSKRITASKDASLAAFRKSTSEVIFTCTSSATVTVATLLANAAAASWTFSRPAIAAQVDVNLFVANEVAKRLLRNAYFDNRAYLQLHSSIKEAWSALPTIRAANPTLQAISGAAAGGPTTASFEFHIPSASGSSGGGPFTTAAAMLSSAASAAPGVEYRVLFDSRNPSLATTITCGSPDEVVRALLVPEPGSEAAAVRTHQLTSAVLSYTDLYNYVTLLQNIAYQQHYTSLHQFIFNNLELFRVVWKNFLLTSYQLIHDKSAAAATISMFPEFLSRVTSLVSKYCTSRSASGQVEPLDASLVDTWYQAQADCAGLGAPELKESYFLAINVHSIATVHAIHSGEGRLSALRGLKRFFVQTVCGLDSVCLDFHDYYLLGHLTAKRRELWNDFWCPLLRFVTPFDAFSAIVLEHWDAMKISEAIKYSDDASLTPVVRALYTMGEEDLAMIRLNSSEGADRLVGMVQSLCMTGYSLRTVNSLLVGMDTDLRETVRTLNMNSALAAAVKQLPVLTVKCGATTFHSYCAQIVRDWRLLEGADEATREKVACYAEVQTAYSDFVAKGKFEVYSNDGRSAENVMVCCASINMLPLAHSIAVSQQKLSCDAIAAVLLQCENVDEFETGMGLFETALADAYVGSVRANKMRAVIERFGQLYTIEVAMGAMDSPSLAYKLLLFLHHCDEASFADYWSAAPRDQQTLDKVESFLSRRMTRREDACRTHLQILFRFYSPEKLEAFFAQMDFKSGPLNREVAISVILGKLGELPDSRQVLLLALAKFILHMPVMRADIRKALTALDEELVADLLVFQASQPLLPVSTAPPTAASEEEAISCVSRDLALALVLCLNNPTDHVRLQNLKRAAESSPLRGRIQLLLRDFSQPGPTVAMLLVDREFTQLADFMVELAEKDETLDRAKFTLALNEITRGITGQALVPGSEAPSTPGRSSKPSTEQCHREFFRPGGLVRCMGRVIAVATELTKLKELVSYLVVEPLKTAVAAFINAIFDLSSFDMLIFNFLKLCSDFSVSTLTSFVTQFNSRGYFNMVEDSELNTYAGMGSTPAAASSSSSSALSIVAPSSSSSGSKDAGASTVDSAIDMVLSVRASYLSDLRKMDDLLNVYTNHQATLAGNVACFATLNSFSVLLHKMFRKQSIHSIEISSLGQSEMLLWIPTRVLPAHQTVRSLLEAMVVKYKGVAAAVFEQPLLDRVNAPVHQDQLALSPQPELRNLHMRKLLQTMSRTVVDQALGANDLWAYVTMDSLPQGCFPKIKTTLTKLLNRPSGYSWLLLLSRVLRYFAAQSSLRVSEILEMVFAEFDYRGARRNIFGPEATDELLTHLLATRQRDVKYELSRCDFSLYSVEDVIRHPQLLACVAAEGADILYDPSLFNVWRSLLRSSKRREMADQLIKVFLSVVQYVASERANARIKNSFEDFVLSFRQCFVGFGAEIADVLFAARNDAKRLLKNKAAVAKLLSPLDGIPLA